MTNIVYQKTIDLYGGAFSVKNSGSGESVLMETGAIFSAAVKARSGNSLHMMTKQGFEFSVSSEAVGSKAEPGDELYFEVQGTKDNRLKLKLVFPHAQSIAHLEKQRSAKNLTKLMVESDFSPVSGNMLADKREYEKKAELEKSEAAAIARIKRELAFSSDNFRSAAVRELVKSGVSLQKIDLGMLNSVSQELRTRLKLETAEADAAPELTKENINKIDEIKTISEDRVLSLIKSGKPMNLGNLYKSAVSAPAKQELMPEETLNELRPMIEKSLESMGLEVNEKNMANAELLVKNNIDLTVENMAKIELVNELKNFDREHLLAVIADELDKGVSFNEIEITPDSCRDYVNKRETEESYRAISRNLPKMNGGYIDFLLKNNIYVSLDNLSRAVLEKSRLQTGLTEEGKEARINKDKLFELQLRLNADNMGLLAAKGIKIGAMPLATALENVKNADNERYSSHIKQIGMEADSGKLGIFEKVFTAMSSVPHINGTGYKSLIKKADGIYIDSIHEARQAEKVSLLYEAAETAVNSKYGDSAQKVEPQYGHLLERLGFAASAENLRAVKILSKTGMELTEENIAQVRLTDAKLSRVEDTLHPRIVAKMLKDGINPLELNIDEILSYIDEFNNEYGAGLKDKIAEKIDEMTRRGDLTAEERKSVIAVYRLLNHIEKNGLASVGVVLNAEKQLTFGNLFDASKYFAKSGSRRNIVDRSVGDSEYRIESRSEIERLANAAQKTSVFRMNEEYIREFTALINTDSLKELMHDDNARDLMLEEVNNLLRETGLKSDQKEKLEYNGFLEKFKDVAPNVIRFLRKNGLKITPDDIDAVKAVSSEKFHFAKQLTRLKAVLEGSESIDDIFAKSDDISAEKIDDIEKLGEKLSGIIDIKIGEDDTGELEKLAELKPVAELFAKMKRGSSVYVLPVKFNGVNSEINMYVRNSKLSVSEGISIAMSFDAGALGIITAYAETGSAAVGVNIACGTKTAKEIITDNLELLKSKMAEKGFLECSVNVMTDERDVSLYSELNSGKAGEVAAYVGKNRR